MATNNKQLIWKAPFKRDGEFPLDRSFIFTTFAEAENYAKLIDQSKGVAYVGQVIAVTGDTVSVYKIVKTGDVGDNEVNLERLDVLYNGSKTIEINDTNINVKVESTSEENKNFIEVSNKGLAVKSIDANKTITAIGQGKSIVKLADIEKVSDARFKYVYGTLDDNQVTEVILIPI